MFTIRKSYNVEYAHQLASAYSKCCSDSIHGHSGKIELFFVSNELDENNMVVDFGEVSALVKKYLMDTFDHALIIPNSFDGEYKSCLAKHNIKLVIVENNPTAEYFCERIYFNVVELLKPIATQKGRTFYVYKVRFHETETGYAEFVPDIRKF